MAIPRAGLDGVRQTVNANLTPAQALWNVRSGLNVAALNCQRARHAPLIENYRSFLNTHSRQLSATNRALRSEFRQKYGPTYQDVQDAYMTQVYNYFALPPALSKFCDVALAISEEAKLVEPGQLDAFTAVALPRMEGVFENFFRSYEKYRIDLAAWDARYGPPTVSTTATGYVNPLDPNVRVAPGQTPVGTMEAQYPVPAPGGSQAPVAIPPATSNNVIVTTPVAPSTAVGPTMGPVADPAIVGDSAPATQPVQTSGGVTFVPGTGTNPAPGAPGVTATGPLPTVEAGMAPGAMDPDPMQPIVAPAGPAQSATPSAEPTAMPGSGQDSAPRFVSQPVVQQAAPAESDADDDAT